MIATIAAWLVARNPQLTIAAATRLVRIGLVVAAAVTIATAVPLWFHFHDAGVIERHKLEQVGKALEGERRANSADIVRADARTAAGDQSDYAMKEAEDADPDAAKAPAGPVSRAAARRFPLRR